MDIPLSNNIPAGYLALADAININVLPNYRESYIAKSGSRQTIITNGLEQHIYPKSGYSYPDTILAHLEFALKHDDINLGILKSIFQRINRAELENRIKTRPNRKYNRMLWFLYEFLTGNRLDIEDLKSGNYFDLLDPKRYYVAAAIKSRRHRVNDNLPGNRDFCPIIRKTDVLHEYEEKHFDRLARALVGEYAPDVIARAVHYLYVKETMSSYEIERARPDKQRTARFVRLLQEAGQIDQITKLKLIELQNFTVDPRFADKDYRDNQNYVGESISKLNYEKVHYIAPKPEDLPDLMDGLLHSLRRMSESKIDPVITAAAISFGFVFLHPFEDGNGRLHRFLIHHILSKTGFAPEGMIFPVSAVMLKKMKEYDQSLETFSRPLMDLIQYDLDSEGRMTVHGDTLKYYQYIDFTRCAEYLYECIEETIRTELVDQLNYLISYDKTKRELQEIVDMPDRLIDLFIAMVQQNNGRLSQVKRDSHYSALTNEEIELMERTVQENMLTDSTGA